ncbi:MAG TPA: hypothetical protein VK846_12485 [Candidatus Limnocylindria bacterium]|nr:hypothetical protein [Candidatus Limnocylindria bacterium]
MSKEAITNGDSANSAPQWRVVMRRPVRVVAVHDEEWIEGEPVPNPEVFVQQLRQEKQVPHLFTFVRPLPHREPSHPFHIEWDNVAVAELSAGYNPWWESLPQETRKNVRRAGRRGVAVERLTFDDKSVRGISNIYNETPIRQGRKFWHYGKSLDRVKAENATYRDRSEFIGAFFHGELIGFIKLVRVNGLSRIMQIVSLEAHFDKRPTNALLAKAVEICCENKATHLIYGKFVYGTKENSPVTEFKRRNGFERLNFPRYYVPVTGMGALALRCGLHRGLASMMPEKIVDMFLATRAAIYRRRFTRQNTVPVIGQPIVAGLSSPASQSEH